MRNNINNAKIDQVTIFIKNLKVKNMFTLIMNIIAK